MNYESYATVVDCDLIWGCFFLWIVLLLILKCAEKGEIWASHVHLLSIISETY